MNDNLKVSQKGLELIKQFEGCVLHVYNDGVGVATIGIGTTEYPDGTPVTFQDPPITIEQAYEYLAYGVEKFENAVRNSVEVELNQNQFDALVSFTYNVGAGGLGKSSLLRKINSGDFNIEQNLLLWNKAGGRVLDGLTSRRKAEWELFSTPVETPIEPTADEGTENKGDQADAENNENNPNNTINS